MKANRLIRKMAAAVALSVISFAAAAAPLTPSEALAALRGSGSQEGMRAARISGGEARPSYVAQADGRNCFYVFGSESGAGYAVVAADDRLPILLGYSETGVFDADRMPCNLRWWLGEYEREISAYLAADPKAGMPEMRSGSRRQVAPLLTTKWNQDAPFNNDCPTDSKTGKRSVTGCVATAMSQLMKHHEWPKVAKGFREGYSFEGVEFDWANMLDVYTDGKYSATQSAAVARLMNVCGQSVDMKYASSASSAQSVKVGNALLEYFGYDPSIRMELRAAHTLDEWEDIVYEEVAAGRPVYFSGRTSEGGHAFICDGYLGNGYFHFNWGWGGSQDGWFRLFALNPKSGGIGSFEGGYNDRQQIFTHVMPDTGRECEPQVLLVAQGGYRATVQDDNSLRIHFDYKGEESGFYNYKWHDSDVEIATRWESLDNPGKTVDEKGFTVNLRTNTGYKAITVRPSLAGDGRWRVRIIYRGAGSEGEWTVLRGFDGLAQYVEVTVRDGVPVEVSVPSEESDSLLVMNAATFAWDRPTVNTPQSVRVTLSNVGSETFDGYNIGLMLRPRGSQAAPAQVGWTYHYTLPAGRSDVIEFNTGMEVPAGDYDLFLEQGGRLFGGQPVALHAPSEQPLADDMSFRMTDMFPNFFNLTDTPKPTVEFSLSEYLESSDASGAYIVVQLCDPATGKVLKSGNYNATYFTSTSSVKRLNFLDLSSFPVGEYAWRAVYKKSGVEKVVSQLFPVKLYRGPREVSDASGNTLCFNLEGCADGEKAVMVNPYDADSAPVDFIVPDNVSGIRVAALAPDMFTFNRSVASVSLPAGVAVGGAQFYCASSLTRIEARGEEPAYCSAEAFAPGAAETITLDVPAGTANLYKRAGGWSRFHFDGWRLRLSDIEPQIEGLAEDPATGKAYAPYYVGRGETVRFRIADTGHSFKVATVVPGQEASILSPDSEGWYTLPALDGTDGDLYINATGGIDAIDADSLTDIKWYSLSGVELSAPAKGETVIVTGTDPSGRRVAGKLRF